MSDKVKMVRFTAWLSETERQAIRDRAKELNASDNYIVRTVIRESLGVSSKPGVTAVTRNN